MTNPGKLHQRVTFQRETLVPDGMGGGTKSWATYATRWANVRPMSGRERFQAQQVEANSNYRLTVRRDSVTGALTDADRVMWNGATMNIRFIANAGDRHLYMQIDCEMGVAT